MVGMVGRESSTGSFDVEVFLALFMTTAASGDRCETVLPVGVIL